MDDGMANFTYKVPPAVPEIIIKIKMPTHTPHPPSGSDEGLAGGGFQSYKIHYTVFPFAPFFLLSVGRDGKKLTGR